MTQSTAPRPVVRQATPSDIAQLVALNHEAYPDLREDNVVWSERQLKSHLEVFPQGQLVAEVEGRLVGAISSLVVDLGPDPLRRHTWAGVTDSGYFTNHDPRADTLYGADVYVHPAAQGRGVGAALYEARRALCRRLNLRRILCGGRLAGYYQHAALMTPEEYVARVEAGELRDRVLSFQLREGFVVRGVVPRYLRDPRSLDHATLIEWLNPDYRPRPRTRRGARIACVQYQQRPVGSFDEFARQVGYAVDVASDYRADFVLFPELFTLQLLSMSGSLSAKEGVLELARQAPAFVGLVRGLALKHGVTIVAGSHPVRDGDRLLNVAHVCLPSGAVVMQPKLHITPNERKYWGIEGGRSLRVIDTPRAKIGVLVCYDVEFPEAARHLCDEGAEIVFVPYSTDNRHGHLRVRYCAQARAIENQCYVALAGNVGNLPEVVNTDVHYGQAAVLTPSDFVFSRDGVKAEADPNIETVLVCDVDLDDLREAHHGGTVTPRLDRRTDLFRFVSEAGGKGGGAGGGL
jgi:predicted amidohydrolase/GNAT superfamily N-acetyltransferase